MSVQGLSIIFAPSILRTTQQMSPMESLRDVTKQAVFVFMFFVAVASYFSKWRQLHLITVTVSVASWCLSAARATLFHSSYVCSSCQWHSSFHWLMYFCLFVPPWGQTALCFQVVHPFIHPSVCPFSCFQTCKHNILKTSEPILMSDCTSGPWGTGMKWSILGFKAPRSRSHEAKDTG